MGGCSNYAKNHDQTVVVAADISKYDPTDTVHESTDKMITISKTVSLTNHTIPSSTTMESKVGTYYSMQRYFPITRMLQYINNIRDNPLIAIDTINSLKNKITVKEDRKYLKFDNDIRINLYKGEETFDNCIDFLKEIYKKKVSLKPLILVDELKIPFPEKNPKDCINNDYIRNVILLKTTNNDKKYNLLDFHYDICIPNPEISIIMQIIDDTNDNFQRRNNIFNPMAKYIGISEGKINDHLACFYLLFAK